MGEHYGDIIRVVGSIPTAPTKYHRRFIMKSIVFALCLILGFPTLAFSKDFTVPNNALIMIHSPFCGFCVKFLRESWDGQKYNQTMVGKEYPFVLLDTNEKESMIWFQKAVDEGLLKTTKGTPTFIFWNNGKESKRLSGYRDWLWFKTNTEQLYNEMKNN